jgi:hypothetical protein
MTSVGRTITGHCGKSAKQTSSFKFLSSVCSVPIDQDQLNTKDPGTYSTNSLLNDQRRLRLEEAYTFASNADDNSSKHCPFCSLLFSSRSSVINHINNRCCSFLKDLNDSSDLEKINQILSKGYLIKRRSNQHNLVNSNGRSSTFDNKYDQKVSTSTKYDSSASKIVYNLFG